ncbi:MAG: alkaline phosphatase family protein [Ferruginibacter sp.]|nr:alkaline phosphatase family protein [Ferruginibacter sp.]
MAFCSIAQTNNNSVPKAGKKLNKPGASLQPAEQKAAKKPKLVVGIVIDQMRWDYLYRFNELYSANGFKRMLGQGFSCENTLIPYMPTYTAPGHTCVYTGSVPAIHGIVGNNWFDKTANANVYCTDDSTVKTVGTTSTAGKMSPRNMWTTTITDELRLSNNFKSKVIGIALKDRGAILPAGHSANAAYWYDNGKWITSSYYMNELPAWVNEVNARDLPARYMSKDWNTLLPIDKYDLSSADDQPYETAIRGEKTVTFPHKTSLIAVEKYEAFKYTPYASTYTFEFAKTAIANEKLGAGKVTDFLAISISSTDYIGHSFGPNSIEAEDAYLRLDKDIADFLHHLDVTLGKGNYLAFLTADHGVAHIPGFLAEHKIPGGTVNDAEISRELNQVIEEKNGIKKAVLSIQNYQVYLNTDEINKQQKEVKEIAKTVIGILKKKPYIVNAVETEGLAAASLPEPQKKMFSNGYNPQRSGDILFTFKPGYFDGGSKGTTHGLWNPYDAHIPLLFFGWSVRQGKTNRETYMTDIAATIAAMLQIQMPNGSVGKVIPEVISN